MKKIFFLFFFLNFFSLYSTEIILKESLAKADVGSYLVLEQNKTFTFFHIFDRTEDKLIIEEVSIPVNRFHDPRGWRAWFEEGALNHTSWTMSMINLHTGRFEEMYSYTLRGWIDISKMDMFMTTLLNARFEEIPFEERRHVGLPPGRGKPDNRPLWHPKLIVNGTWIPNIYFVAWKTRWPSDGSELSRKNIEMYLPEESSEKCYPTFFPYLIEIEGKIGSARMRVVDSGLNAISPKTRMPLRSISFSGNPELNEKGLFIAIKSPSYFTDFLLFGEEVSSFFQQPLPLPFVIYREKDSFILFVETNTLLEHLKTGNYRFLITPKEDPSFCIETKQIFDLSTILPPRS